jgi:hypothetical protein
MIDDRFTELDLSPDNSARWFGRDAPTVADANDAEPANNDPTV